MNISSVKTGLDLIGLIGRGNDSAFTKFYTSYFEKLILVSDKYVKDIHEAEEIVQDVFLKIWEEPDKISNVLSIKSYLYKSVINSSVNFVNRQKNIELHHAKLKPDFSDEYLNNLDEESEIIVLISHEIEKLPEQCKKVFKLSRFENLKHKEIAALLNISSKTVENHISVALKHLRIRFLNDEFLKNKSKNYLSILNTYLF